MLSPAGTSLYLPCAHSQMTPANIQASNKQLWSSAKNRLIKIFFAIVEWFKPAYTLTEQVWAVGDGGETAGGLPWLGPLPQ